MKTHVITLSKNFLKGHPKAGQSNGFKEAFLSGKKIHTIRGNYDYWATKIDEVIQGKAILSVREWIDKPYKKPGQVEIAKLTAADRIGVQEIFMTYDWTVHADIDDIYSYQIDKLIKNDALTETDFINWFWPPNKENKPFSGVIIHFTKFRY